MRPDTVPAHFNPVLAMPMKTFKLSDGSEVPWIAFGTGTAYYKKGCKGACELALSLGFTHIDTAEMYNNEEDVGSAIKSSGIPRESLYMTTKLGSAIPPGETVEDALRVSLEKMQLDYVDLYLAHAPIPHYHTPGGLKQVWKGMVDVKKGLARSIGVSNFNIKYLEEVVELGLEKPVVNQMEYHVFVSTRLEPLIDFSRKHGIVTASFASLFLLNPEKVTDEIASAVGKVKAVLDEIAQARGPSVTQSQVIFKRLQAKGIIAVTTSTKESRMKEYLDVDDFPDLTPEEMEKIEQSTGGVHHQVWNQGSFIDDSDAGSL